jgi:tetratricopeptide (TPR) repeat protein
LAHEIGHHLNGHTLSKALNLAEQRKRELEADEFSGFVMCKIGATLAQSKAAISTVANNDDDSNSDHPSLDKRIAAITKGYNNAKGLGQISNVSKKPSAEKYFSEGNALYFQNNYKKAIEKFNLAISLKPNYTNAYLFRGLAKDDMEDYNGAMADYKKAIELEPNNEDGYIAVGNLKKNLKDYEGAIVYCTKAINIAPNSTWQPYFVRAMARYFLNDFQGAIEDCDKSIQLDPSNGQTYWNRGLSKMRLGTQNSSQSDKVSMCADFKKGCELGITEACDYLKVCK